MSSDDEETEESMSAADLQLLQKMQRINDIGCYLQRKLAKRERALSSLTKSPIVTPITRNLLKITTTTDDPVAMTTTTTKLFEYWILEVKNTNPNQSGAAVAEQSSSGSGDGFRLECVYLGKKSLSGKIKSEKKASLTMTNVEGKEEEGKKEDGEVKLEKPSLTNVKWALLPIDDTNPGNDAEIQELLKQFGVK